MKDTHFICHLSGSRVLGFCCFSLHQSIRSTIVVSSQPYLRSAEPGYCFYPCKWSGMRGIRLKKQVCCFFLQYLIIMLQLNTKIRFFIKQIPCVLIHVFTVKGRVSHPVFVIHTGRCAYVARGGLRNQPSEDHQLLHVAFERSCGR